MSSEEKVTVKKKMDATKKEKLIKRIIAVTLVLVAIVGSVPAAAITLRWLAFKEYKKAYEITANQPFVSGDTLFDVDKITDEELETLMFGETETTLAEEIQVAYGEDIDVNKFYTVSQYVKDRYREDAAVMKDANGESIISGEYAYTQQNYYLLELDNIVCFIKAKDAINDLHKRIVEDAFYTPTVEAIKTESCFELREPIERIVADEALKAELFELSDKVADIVYVAYGNVVDVNEFNENKDDLPDALAGYSGTFSFDNLSEDMLQNMWLASTDSMTYKAYGNYYLTSEEDAELMNLYIEKANKYYDKLSSLIDLIPVTSEEKTSKYLSNKINTYIRKNFNEVTDAELEYISARLDADYWLWQSMLGAGALEQGELIFFTDSDRWMDYQVEIVAANGHENPIQRYSWAYAHQMVISYISYLAGNDDLAVAGIVGARDENLVEQYALLYQAIANDGLKRIYCFSDYISSTE